MKKSLVLAMAMALGVTASAYAANPFSDVPAGHWAYDSIDKLAAAGVIDGMGDGTYQGDKTMTRYEMAQIVAKAMAKGANVDKLAAEFADELDNLGVRVANLEKKADNVKITGAINLYTRDGHGAARAYDYKLRSDLTISGQINSDWKYTALLRNEQQFTKTKGTGDESVNFQRAYVDGRIGGAKVRAGRWHRSFASNEIWGTRIDGVEASYGKKVAVTVGYAQLSDAVQDATGTVEGNLGDDAKIMYAEVGTKVAKVVGVQAGYYAFKDISKTRSAAASEVTDMDVASLTLTAPVVKNVTLTAVGMKAFKTGDMTLTQTKKSGLTAKLQYKGAKAAAPGSFGVYAKYVDIPQVLNINNTYTTNSFIPTKAGIKGMQYGAQYVFAKNITGTIEWYQLKEKINDKNNQTLFAGLTFAF